MVDMSNLLGRVAGSVEPPKQLPPGDYIFRVLSVGPERISAAGNQMIDFLCQAETPVDVDHEQLDGVSFPVKMRHTMVVTENSLYRLSDFLIKHLGLPANEQLKDLITQTPGHIFRGTVIHQSGTKPGDDKLYANIGVTSAA